MKKQFTILSTKLIQKASKMSGKAGSTTPGHIAKKIDKDILEKMRKNVENVIFVSGTNGKTTTSQVLAAILTEDSGPLVHNIEGANMLAGITTAFVTSQNIKGNKKYKYAVIEIDEGSIEKVFKEIKPDYFVFTNFFRDQLDRFGEIDMLVDKIKNQLDDKEIQLLLNVDDPYTRRLSNGKNTTYFGIGVDAYNFGKQTTIESTYCPKCGEKLHYKKIHYGQLGHYSCFSCTFKRPDEKYKTTKIELNNGINLQINYQNFETNIFGDYNAMNIAGAIATAKELGIKNNVIQNALTKLFITNGRMEYIKFDDKNILLNLAKNPAGLNVSFENIKNLNGEKNVLLLLNDNGADGRDISWIWDADFESLKEMNVNHFYCSGLRAEELALRLKYAGIEEGKISIDKDIKDVLKKSIEKTENLFVIPNYTLLETTRKEILKLQNEYNRKEASK